VRHRRTKSSRRTQIGANAWEVSVLDRQGLLVDFAETGPAHKMTAVHKRSVIGLISIVAVGAGCGGTSDPHWSAPFSGRRAFNSFSTVQSSTNIANQALTITIDADQRIAIIGGDRKGTSSAVIPAGSGAFRLTTSVTISDGFTTCPSDSVRYDDLELTVDTAAGTLTGSGRGQINKVDGDVVDSSAATVTLTGTADTQPPTVGIYTPGAMISDPFVPFTFSSSEPLPPDSRPVFRSATGDVVTPTCLPGDAFYVDCTPPGLLPFDQAYTVDVANVADFAGNRATTDDRLLIFGTGSAPMLVAADGFESQTDMTLFGTASFVSAPNFPVISGVRSLYVPPEGVQPAFAGTTFALRLPIAPGATVLRFSYRILLRDTTPGSDATYLVGSVGSPLVTTMLPTTNGTTEPVTIGGAQFTLGPLATATINLPDPNAAEVMLARTVQPPACGRPLPPPGGIIIDDLRTE
jgi:hypothetical protein